MNELRWHKTADLLPESDRFVLTDRGHDSVMKIQKGATDRWTSSNGRSRLLPPTEWRYLSDFEVEGYFEGAAA